MRGYMHATAGFVRHLLLAPSTSDALRREVLVCDSEAEREAAMAWLASLAPDALLDCGHDDCEVEHAASTEECDARPLQRP